MKPKTVDAVTPRDLLERLIGVSGNDILIGGQALAVWVDIYDLEISEDVGPITRDVDFLTTSPTSSTSLQRYSKVLGGQTHIYDGSKITAMVGQAYKFVSDEETLNVDVLWKVVGLDSDSVRANALRLEFNGIPFLVMHPVDVLRSRLANLHQLPEKANEMGERQLDLAIDVVRAYLRSLASDLSPEALAAGRSPLQPVVSLIEKLALDDAGRKVAKRHGIHVADAIDPTLIPAGPFWEKKWPTLKTLMSTQYASTIKPPGVPGSGSRGGSGRRPKFK